MAKAIFFTIYLDKVWAETMIPQPIFYLCQQIQSLTLPVFLLGIGYFLMLLNPLFPGVPILTVVKYGVKYAS